MKKLLSILAGLAITASSASAVVSCTAIGSPYERNTDNRHDNNNDDIPSKPANGNNNNNNNNSMSGGTTDNGSTTGKGGTTDNGDTTKPVDPATKDKNTRFELNNFQNDAQLFGRKSILQDQFGLDGNYINSLFGGVDPSSKAHKVVTDGLNTTGTYGSAADKFPLLSWLHNSGILDDKTYSTIADTVLPLLDGIDAPSPSQLAAVVKTALAPFTLIPGIKNPLKSLIKDPDKVKKTVDGILTPKLGEFLNILVEQDNKLTDSLSNYTNAQALEIVVIGIANILSDGFNVKMDVTSHGNGLLNPFSKNADPISSADIDNLANDAEQFISDQLISIIFGDAKTKPTFDITRISNERDVSMIWGTVKLLGYYLGQFDQFNNGTLSQNAVFNNNGKDTYDTVMQVRSQKIDTSDFTFNILKFIENLTYYLDDLDSIQGEYRLQALFSILFMDNMDRTSADKLYLSWTADKANNQYDNVTDAEATEGSQMTPINKIINDFIPKMMKAVDADGKIEKVLDKLNGIAIVGKIFKNLTWEAITEAVRHDAYMLTQIIAWNKPFTLAKETILTAGLESINLSELDNGWSGNGLIKLTLKGALPFDGLITAVPEWGKLEAKGLLDYLFNGNIYELVSEISPDSCSDSLGKTYKSLFSLLSTFGVKDDIRGMISDGTAKVLKLLDPVANHTPAQGENIILNGSLGDYDQVTFKSNGMISTLNAKDTGTPYANDYVQQSHGAGAYPDPDVKDVTAGNYDASSDSTEITMQTENIYNSTINDKRYGKGTKSYGPSDFAATIKVDGHSIIGGTKGITITPTTSGNNENVTFTFKVNGKVSADTNVSATAWNYLGTKFLGVGGYDYREIGSHGVNLIKWQNDALGMKDIIGKITNNNFSGSALSNVTKIALDNDQIERLSGLQIIGTNKDNPNGTNVIKDIHTNSQGSLNLETLAAWSISSLLRITGLAPFDQSKSPLGLAIFDNNTIGELILNIGSLLNADDKTNQKDITAFNDDLEPQNFKHLVNALFNNSGENAIDKIIDDLSQDKASVMASSLQTDLGLVQGSYYNKDSILGAIMYAFTPGLQGGRDDKDSGAVIKADPSKDSPFLYYLINNGSDKGPQGLIMRAWALVNDKDNARVLGELDNDKNFTWGQWDTKTKADGTFDVASCTVTYKYEWLTGHNDDYGTPIKGIASGTYKITVNNADDANNMTWTISKN